MPLVPRKQRHPTNQRRSRDERILACQQGRELSQLGITASNILGDRYLTVSAKNKEERAAFSVRKPLFRQQFFLRDNEIMDLPLFVFQVFSMPPMIQIVDENIGVG
jgi:hypothetical protein